MNVKIIQGSEVTRPDTTPLKSSLLDHVRAAGNLVETSDFGLRNNAGLWPSYNCLDLMVPTAICPDPEAVEEVKNFSSASWVPGFEFALQGGVQCSALGLDQADQLDEVERVFSLTEGRGIEEAMLRLRFANSDPINNPDALWWGPNDVSAPVPVELPVALALLEGYAAANYAGVPTIHMPRAAASLLGSDKIVWEGDLAYTRLGSKVAIGGGYDPEVPEGTWDMYVTGEVYIERAAEFSINSYVLPGDGSNARGFDDNTVLTLAERMFRVGVDCFVAKATGTVW